MKQLFLTGVLGLFLLGSCQSKHTADAHDGDLHETESHEGHHHSHEGHTHDHEGHNHAHESHNHGHEAHNHGHESHSHEAEGHEGNSDEIILTPAQAQAAGVEVATIETGSFRQTILVGGELLAAQGYETQVVAPVSGVVRLHTHSVEGNRVAAGGILLTLDSRGLQQGDPVAQARNAYETAQKEWQRMEKLAAERIVSERELAPVRQAYADARNAYEALQANHSAQGQRITAPTAGFIKELLVKEGEYVSVGQPLLSLTQTSRLRLRADVPARHAAALRSVRSANFCTPADGQTYALDSLHGRLLAIGQATTTGSRYLPVTFELDNRGQLLPGQPVEINLLGSEQGGVIVLPRTALTEEQGSFFVYEQLDEEGYRKQRVEVAADDGLQVLIASGVKAGQRIVVRGAYQVKLAGASSAIPAHSHEH